MTRKHKPLPLLQDVVIEAVAAEGKSLFHVDERVVFVPFCVPGDVVDVQITRKKHNYKEGVVVQFKAYSDVRAVPTCQHFGVCGGCKWQNLPYEAQLAAKQQQVVDQLTRIGKVELLLVKTTDHRLIIAESRGVQNITAYTRRDRHRPKRDAFVGMLPPKLAQIMLNLALGAGSLAHQKSCSNSATGSASSLSDKSMVLRTALPDAFDLEETTGSRPVVTILDPFCGTGTVLQEALLAGYDVVGTDLSQKMVDYTTENLSWLQLTFTAPGNIIDIHQADTTTHRWLNSTHLTAIVCETYLGQPFSVPPTPQKLAAVVGNCNHIITSFLTNIRPQLAPNTPLCIAVPAWYDASGQATHLPLIKHLQQLDYHHLNRRTPLIYRRPDQVVARELLILQAT